MPNCDFYATPQDQHQLLEWLFAEGRCHVYELYSDFGAELQRFASTPEVLAQFERSHPTGKPWTSVYLQLYVLDAGPPLVPRRLALNPQACNGATHRYVAEGWGLVQLYLHRPTTEGLEASHSNHFTHARGQALARTPAEQAEVAGWNFPAITAFSGRLNRKIKSLSVGKLGSRAVLPGALEIWRAGAPLLPYRDVAQAPVVVLHTAA